MIDRSIQLVVRLARNRMAMMCVSAAALLIGYLAWRSMSVADMISELSIKTKTDMIDYVSRKNTAAPEDKARVLSMIDLVHSRAFERCHIEISHVPMHTRGAGYNKGSKASVNIQSYLQAVRLEILREASKQGIGIKPDTLDRLLGLVSELE